MPVKAARFTGKKQKQWILRLNSKESPQSIDLEAKIGEHLLFNKRYVMNVQGAAFAAVLAVLSANADELCGYIEDLRNIEM